MKTIYVTIPVEQELPDNKAFGVHVLLKNGIDIDSYNNHTKEWTVEYDRQNNEVTHWLKPVTTLAELIKHCPEVREDQGWVRVEDGLPEINCDVWVVKKNGKVFQMSYHQPFDSGKKIFQWWAFGKWIDQHSQVTHWRPLPSPPKPLQP